MRDAWIAGAGFVFGWLMSKTWDDPGCRLGLALFLVLGAVMFLAFAFAVVGHGNKEAPPPPDEEDDEDDDGPEDGRRG